MERIRNREALGSHIDALKGAGKTIGLVPTMGALHPGHLSLVALAKEHADAVGATIFVNPTQFGPNEDFSRYPRTEKEDIAALESVGTDFVYIPDVASIYPEGAHVTLKAGGMADVLCGAHRPGHFDGVVTVVHRLLTQVRPDVAVFGEKDFQQLFLIREMVAREKLPVTILGAPILREADGLAMSSRNRYLSPVERKTAALLHQTLQKSAARILKGELAEPVLKEAISTLKKAGFDVDYLELRDSETLTTLSRKNKTARLFAAARLGSTRLIDNLALFEV